ncbi:MAG: hypothetical protein NC402_05545 [Prevotella sp.]|nr:hypothetical protein [Prevotella sp.]
MHLWELFAATEDFLIEMVFMMMTDNKINRQNDIILIAKGTKSVKKINFIRGVTLMRIAPKVKNNDATM